MARKSRQQVEFGDFQTPAPLANRVCKLLARRGVRPRSVLEPTCGRGNFLVAAARAFPQLSSLHGIEIKDAYVRAARRALQQPAETMRKSILRQNVFTLDWSRLIKRLEPPLLILGNPPWVTNAELGAVGSQNLPAKSNVHHHKGLDAVTGRANFDVSEWLWIKAIQSVRGHQATLAMLCKTSVARRVLQYAWKNSIPLAAAQLYGIDAQQEFGAAVDACLLVVDMSPSQASNECRVFDDLSSRRHGQVFGWRDEAIVSDVDAFERRRSLYGSGPHRWRSGIKHDCAKVMELTEVEGRFLNGLGETVDLERRFLFPLLKSSDLARQKQARRKQGQPRRCLLVTQRRVAQDTAPIEKLAPATWQYLQRHAVRLDRRASSIYRGRPRFSIFGVGPYTFSRWKVAISGFYKQLAFNVVGPYRGRPTVFDDTCNVVPCASRREATFVAELLSSDVAQDALRALVFWDAKRPITIDLLNRLDVTAVAKSLGRDDQWPSAGEDPQRRIATAIP